MKKIYQWVDKTLKQSRLENVIAIALAGAVLTGCAQVESQQQATHNWTANQRILKVQFATLNEDCVSRAVDVQSYESCMRDYGYRLKTRG